MRYTQPQSGARIDWANPLTKGLACLVDQHGRDLVASRNLQQTGAFSSRATEKGVGKSNGGAAYLTSSSRNFVAPTDTAFSIVGTIALNSTGQTNKYLAYAESGTGGYSQAAIIFGYAANSIEIYSPSFVGSNPRTGSAIAITDTKAHTFGYSYDGSTYCGYLDGKEVFSTTRSFDLNLPNVNLSGSLFSANASDIANVTILEWATYSRGIGQNALRQLTANPNQLFQSQPNPIWVPVTAAAEGGVVSDATAAYLIRGAITSDATASYDILNSTSVASDASAGYAIRSSLTADNAASYAIRSAVTSDTSPAYAVRTSALAESTASYLLRALVTSEASASYSILNAGAVTSDSFASYGVRGVVQSDASVAYELRGVVQSTASAGYDIRSAVSKDASAAYLLRGEVTSDSAGSYAVRGAAQADASVAYSLRGAEQSALVAGYDIRAALLKDMAASYGVRGMVASDMASSYSVLAAVPVFSDLVAAYAVLGAAPTLNAQDIALIAEAVWAYQLP